MLGTASSDWSSVQFWEVYRNLCHPGSILRNKEFWETDETAEEGRCTWQKEGRRKWSAGWRHRAEVVWEECPQKELCPLFCSHSSLVRLSSTSSQWKTLNTTDQMNSCSCQRVVYCKYQVCTVLIFHTENSYWISELAKSMQFSNVLNTDTHADPAPNVALQSCCRIKCWCQH